MPAAASNSFGIYVALASLLRTFPSPLRGDLLEHLHRTFSDQYLPTISDPVVKAEAASQLARAVLEDLAEPAKDGLSLQPIQADTTQWIDALAIAVKRYTLALKRGSSVQTSLASPYTAFLLEMRDKTQDEDLKQYLRGCLKKLVQDLQSQGLPCQPSTLALEKWKA